MIFRNGRLQRIKPIIKPDIPIVEEKPVNIPIEIPQLYEPTEDLTLENDDNISVFSFTDSSTMSQKIPSKVSLMYNQNEIEEYYSKDEELTEKKKYKPKKKPI